MKELADGFSSCFSNPLKGTVAAGDGIVFKMEAPSNEDVDQNVVAFFVRKGYYAYGLQV